MKFGVNDSRANIPYPAYHRGRFAANGERKNPVSSLYKAMQRLRSLITPVRLLLIRNLKKVYERQDRF